MAADHVTIRAYREDDWAAVLRRAGAWTIALEGNARARRLYEREGFQVARAFLRP